MAFLTDRSFTTGVTLQDLIHIVNPIDLSQGNPAGSSYKASIQQVSDVLLPIFTATSIYEVGTGVDSTQRIGVGADASGDYSLVGGGTGNTASGNYSFVGGGRDNTVFGQSSTIGGGRDNTASDIYTTIGGGRNNSVNYNYSTISGGYNNTTNNSYSTISGGYFNTTSGCYSFIGGGFRNTIDLITVSGGYNLYGSTIGGGSFNTISSYSAYYDSYGNTIAGGTCNTTVSSFYNAQTIGGGFKNTTFNDFTTIGGGSGNTSNDRFSTVGGGCQNKAAGFITTIGGGGTNSAYYCYSTVSGGICNSAIGDSSVIGGGKNNTIILNNSTISGGYKNTINGPDSFIGGGFSNKTISTLSTIVGGTDNRTNCDYSSILGGSGNTISHCFSSAVGRDITSVSACTFHVNYLALQNTPVTDSTNNNVLVRDTSTGVVKTKNISTHNYGLFTQTGDSTTVTATVAETTIIGPGLGSLIVPANGFSVGDSFSLVIGGHISFNGADTLTVKVKSNSTTLASTGAINMQNSTDKHWQLKVDFTIRALGGLGVASIATLGSFSYVENAADKFDGYDISNVESSLFNTTISNTLDVTVQYSSTSATNNMYSEVMTLTKTY